MMDQLFAVTFDAERKIWIGAHRRPVYHEDCAVGFMAWQCLRNWPKNICQISDTEDRTMSNQEVYSQAVSLAIFLKENGFRHRDIVGIAAKNSSYVMPLAVGCFFNATPFHAVNPGLEINELGKTFEITRPKIIFCDGKDYVAITAVTKSWNPTIYTLTDAVEGVPNIEDLLKPHPLEMFYMPEKLQEGGKQTAAILCSSGTTGPPKAVCVSSAALLEPNLFLTSEDVGFTTSTLDWGTGLMGVLRSAIYGSTRIISDMPFSAKYFAELVTKYKITSVALAPWHVVCLLSEPGIRETDFSGISLAFVVGGWVSSKALQELQDLFGSALVGYGYGTSECGGVCGNMNMRLGNTAGKVTPGVRLRIVDENGVNLGYNEIGEILVYPIHAWSGYYNNLAETLRIMDSDGWLHTGDMGKIDQNNNLWVVDRIRETLKYKSVHYWPTEIENVIGEIPEVANVCVFGVFNERYGDCAAALVVPKENAELTEDFVKDYVAKRVIVESKQLNAGVRFVKELPKSLNGKFLRRAALEIYKKLLEA